MTSPRTAVSLHVNGTARTVEVTDRQQQIALLHQFGGAVHLVFRHRLSE